MLKTIVLSVLAAMIALGGDISGKWTASVPGRDGNTREVPYNFKVDGDKLTGTVGGFQGNEIEIQEGKVSGNDISFKTKMEFNGNSMIMNYKGTVMGDEIKMQQTREGGSNPPREFVAKRVKAS